jgi:hypothetical protein
MKTVDRILGESADTLVDLATQVVKLVAECGGHKRQLSQVLAKLRKIKMPDHTAELALSGDIMRDQPEADLVGALARFLKTYTETQEDLEEYFDPDNPDAPDMARFPVMDAALTIIDRYGQLTDEIYEMALLCVSSWDRFESFAVGSRPHVDEKYQLGYGP